VKIAVDAMGGDQAPETIVQGSVEAVRELNVSVILVGDERALHKELAKTGPAESQITVKHCTEAALMDESPIEVLRHKKDASVRVAFNLVKSGEADAAVSAGNSGATLAVATVVLGRMNGVERPGVASILPSVRGQLIIIDVGVNVDCKPSFLLQFGVMAHAYAQAILKIEEPRLALLSIGEEDSKGNLLVRQTHDLFKKSSLNFIGNIEGRDLYSDQADIVVCDGFVGNVVLKLSEGLTEIIAGMLEDELKHGPWPPVDVMILRKLLNRFHKKVDYAEFGGAPLLGVRGIGIISHGRSSPKAIKNAIRTAAEFVRQKMPDRLQAGLDESKELIISPN